MSNIKIFSCVITVLKYFKEVSVQSVENVPISKYAANVPAILTMATIC